MKKKNKAGQGEPDIPEEGTSGWMVWKGLTEGYEGAMGLPGKRVPGRGHSKCKGPEAETCLKRSQETTGWSTGAEVRVELTLHTQAARGLGRVQSRSGRVC